MKKLLAFIIITLGTISISLAQAPPPSGSPPSSFVGAPIDDHVWLLAFALALYGIYAIMEKRGILKKAV